MSAAGCVLTEDQLLCGICLDVFNSPVTLPCGHNFCKACISKHWDSSVQVQCPTCKESYYKRLDLRVNTFISEMAAQFRKSVDLSCSLVAKPGDVACDVCTKPRMKAIRSCLVCLASYCETHLKPHLTSSRLMRHQLTDPVENLECRMCTIHDKPLELFCKTDQTCVCMLCPVLDHRAHDVVPLKVQFEEKKAKLGKMEAELHRLIQERRLKIDNLKHSVSVGKQAAEQEMEDSALVFSALIEYLERAQAKLIGTIEEKQKTTEERARGLIEELEKEISELMSQRVEVERLSRSKDQLSFVQSFTSLETPKTKNWTEVKVDPPSYKGIVKSAVDQVQETLRQDMKKLMHESGIGRRKRFAVNLTLDPKTAHSALVLSDDGKRVHHGVVRQNLPENPQRFNPSCCVLAKQSFSYGKFYFEVTVKGKTRWTVGVARESIKRKGIIPLCPENGHWCIWVKNGDEVAALVGSPQPIARKKKLEKVGVFVHYEEGLVSFYDADSSDSLLYSFTGCSFTEKIYPFFSPGLNNDGVNSSPMILSGLGRNASVKRLSLT